MDATAQADAVIVVPPDRVTPDWELLRAMTQGSVPPLTSAAAAEETGKATGKDAGAGKATLVGLLGLDRARAQAERLAAQAREHLDSLGERADLLRMLADYTIARRS